MLGESPGNSKIERVIYGDNVAAIGMASAMGGTSWRTRHLRIRASYVREALEGTAPGGVWKVEIDPPTRSGPGGGWVDQTASWTIFHVLHSRSGH